MAKEPEGGTRPPSTWPTTSGDSSATSRSRPGGRPSPSGRPSGRGGTGGPHLGHGRAGPGHDGRLRPALEPGLQTEREKTQTQHALDQNRKILDLVFSKQEQVNMRAMALITQANTKGLGDEGKYVIMVRDFYQDMITRPAGTPTWPS